MIRLGREAWETFAQGTGREWLETNGLGGWAYGTVLGANSRFYHGLLVAALQPPVQRMVLVSKLAETLLIDGRPHRLDCNAWASGAVEEEGRLHLRQFALAPLPTFTYTFGDVTLTKTIFMRHGHNVTLVRYHLEAGDPARSLCLQIAPLVAHRTIHGVQRGAHPWQQETATPGAHAPLEVTLRPGDTATPLHLYASGGTYRVTNTPVYGLHYPYEQLRGEPTEDDVLEAGQLTADLRPGETLSFAASAGPLDEWSPAHWQADEELRRANLLTRAGTPATPLRQALVLAADQFLVHRSSTETHTVIAGYPWFTDWGRDTMIALPGLTLATGRPEIARELLLTFARHERDGLIPNMFPDEGNPPLYNTADASLWFFQAVRRYLDATGDDATIQELYPVLRRILNAHLTGTHFEIRATAEGLLHCGNPSVQVTWMDAKIGDWVVTPRDGFPVEIQALWHGALRIMHELAARRGEPDAGTWATLADRTAAAFRARFWHKRGGYLLDRLTSQGAPDATLRPNQLFALSLLHPLLSGEQARSVVRVCWQHLLTPYGLRSLSPDDPAYMGVYAGDRRARDAAYHQGTTWAWLLGPFVRAYLAAFGHSPQTHAQVRLWLEPLWHHLHEAGLGSISENFDGNVPFTPRACVAQAWSVAEALEIIRLVEEHT